mmetsp:Transcript_22228/g.46171  ORF Transcript_22228/g.46171 Transcript_22228/m.46171 type:complete len:167 (+) Transcript_22228:88-588(+)|eukprot:CAMPEP_0118653942 /NCGR_PEP_ID=MMETSP0785-20121206/12101_1 /TAXON_ID=91992 /ORGANISM="Bolidomonas pacifica, Strain CCMP 1866" /LENGTH=166 /DNA_ID=CAMNT_0006546521 /DNA_START=60 /DNA_END=560 /DNA_ORIENTATION=-
MLGSSVRSTVRSVVRNFPPLHPVSRPLTFLTPTPLVLHGGPKIDKSTASKITVNWLYHDGKIRTVDAYVGQTLLQVAHTYKIELEGACEGVCACSTCHTIFSDDMYDSLPEPSEDEEDMLDMAYGLQPTSRLGCQIVLTEDMDGVEVQIPQATRNFYVDGHVPQPH